MQEFNWHTEYRVPHLGNILGAIIPAIDYPKMLLIEFAIYCGLTLFNYYKDAELLRHNTYLQLMRDTLKHFLSSIGLY